MQGQTLNQGIKGGFIIAFEGKKTGPSAYKWANPTVTGQVNS